MRLVMLTVLDEHTRECHVLRADRALKSGDVIKLVQGARIPAIMELLRGIREPTYAFIDSTLDRLRFTVYRSLSVLGIA